MIKRCASAAVLVILFMGCSQEPPEILQKFHQIHYRDDTETGTVYPELSLFIQADDEDGYEDLEYLYIVQDDAELVWEIDAEEWAHRDMEGESWIGSNSIVMADFSSFPEGVYRIILIDKAGERNETEMYLDTVGAPPALPEVRLDETTLTVSGAFQGYSLRMYDGDTYIGTRQMTGNDIPLEELRKEGASSFYLYTYDNNRGRGILRGPYYL